MGANKHFTEKQCADICAAYEPRKHAGMTTARLAGIYGCTPRTILRIIHGGDSKAAGQVKKAKKQSRAYSERSNIPDLPIRRICRPASSSDFIGRKAANPFAWAVFNILEVA